VLPVLVEPAAPGLRRTIVSECAPSQ